MRVRFATFGRRYPDEAFSCFGLLSLMSIFVVSSARESDTTDKSATQAPTAPQITVKGDVMKKRLIHKATPSYPYQARQMRISGTVILHALIGVDGSVKQAEYVSGPKILVEPTIEAVRQNKYKSTTEKWPARWHGPLADDLSLVIVELR
jgi:hypothetical protein